MRSLALADGDMAGLEVGTADSRTVAVGVGDGPPEHAANPASIRPASTVLLTAYEGGHGWRNMSEKIAEPGSNPAFPDNWARKSSKYLLGVRSAIPVCVSPACGGGGGGRATGAGEEEWWRWGRIELPVQNRVAGDFLQVFPAYLRFALRAPDRRGAPLAIRCCLSALCRRSPESATPHLP